MPSKPAWYSRLDQIIADLEALPYPWVDRGTVEFLLRVGTRRAQQIMAPCITDRMGANGLADRGRLICHLRGIACGDDARYENIRRRKVAQAVNEMRQRLIDSPPLLVEAPATIRDQDFDGLPAGVRIESGRITVEFGEPSEALEKLLALAMAIGNDPATFERLAARHESAGRF